MTSGARYARPVWFLASLFLAWMPAGRSWAQVPVAVLPFSGAGAGAVARDVQRALEHDDRVSVVDRGRTESVARRTGASADGSVGVAEAATELNASLLIQGEITGPRRRKRLKLVARDGSGRQIASSGGPARGGAIARAVRELLDSALPRVSSSSSRPSADASATRTVDDEHPSRFDDEIPESQTERDVSMQAPIFTLQVGALPRSRVANVTLVNGGSNGYGQNGGNWFFEVGARTEVRPFARNTDGLQGLYARLDFGYAVGLSAREPAGGSTVSASFFQVQGNLGYLIPLADILELGGELGGGVDSYALGTNATLASAEYPYLRVAARARIRLYREFLVLGIDGGYRLTLSRGGFGTYGNAGDTYGGDVGGGLGGGIPFNDWIGFTWMVDVRYVGYGLNFAGTAPVGLEGRYATEDAIQIGAWLGLGFW